MIKFIDETCGLLIKGIVALIGAVAGFIGRVALGVFCCYVLIKMVMFWFSM